MTRARTIAAIPSLIPVLRLSRTGTECGVVVTSCDSLTGSPIALDYQKASTSAGLRCGNVQKQPHENGHGQSAPAEVATAGSGGSGGTTGGREVKTPVRTLWEEDEDEEEEEQGAGGGG